MRACWCTLAGTAACNACANKSDWGSYFSGKVYPVGPNAVEEIMGIVHAIAFVCPTCQKCVGEHDIFCRHCGRKIKLSCEKCGKNLHRGMSYCPQCGTAVKE